MAAQANIRPEHFLSGAEVTLAPDGNNIACTWHADGIIVQQALEPAV